MILPLFSCNDTERVRGQFLDIDNMKIFDFKESKLNVFDLNDSIEQVYSINYNNDKILFENTHFDGFAFVKNNYGLILTPSENNTFLKNEIKLKKIENEKIDVEKKMFDTYWVFRDFQSVTDSIYYLIRVPANYRNTGYLYKKAKNYDEGSFYRNNDDFYFVDRVFISQKVFFNKFNFVKIDYPIFNNAWFYIEDLSASKLKLLDVNSNKNIVLEKYNNPNLVSFDRRWHQ